MKTCSGNAQHTKGLSGIIKIGSLLKVWILFFLYTCLASIFIQCILLPYILSKWHAGGGLLISSIDSILFQRIAVDLAAKIKTIGWLAWELRPQGYAPAGIAAAIYAITVPKLWTLIPLHAVLHATAAIVILRLVLLLLPDFKKALFCVLPFVVYPSAANWYAQIHKDGYAILGLVLIIYGWVLFFKEAIKLDGIRMMLLSIVYIISGAFLVWIVRPYMEMVTAYLGLCLSLFMFCIFVSLCIAKRLTFKGLLTVMVLNLLVIFVVLPRNIFKMPGIETFEVRAQRINKPGMIGVILALREDLSIQDAIGKSSIDTDTQFSSLTDILLYVPRAIQIGFFAPFPNQWPAQGSFESTTFQRKVVAIEMLGVYLALLFLPFTVWYWRKRIELWIILFFSVSLLMIHALLISNIGSLYRVRYGPIMVIVGLCIAGFIKTIELHRR